MKYNDISGKTKTWTVDSWYKPCTFIYTVWTIFYSKSCVPIYWTQHTHTHTFTLFTNNNKMEWNLGNLRYTHIPYFSHRKKWSEIQVTLSDISINVVRYGTGSKVGYIQLDRHVKIINYEYLIIIIILSILSRSDKYIKIVFTVGWRCSIRQRRCLKILILI